MSAEVRGLERRADVVLEDVFRALFEEIDLDKVREEVAGLRGSAEHGYDPLDHARAVARRTGIRCAAAGAVTGLHPVGVLTLGALGAEVGYLVYQQLRMVLAIAVIYGHEPSDRERFSEALSCLAFSSSAGIGSRIIRGRLTRFIPVVGAISAGALNYAAVQTVARAAIRHYDSRVDPVLAAEIWAEGDREHA
ncbi:MAG TPA: hypothetical protein VM779_00575 [Thermoanaerobaculia bacterium]|nr:hypothetical protein [Thermoanaerobaculia bacterium]